MARSQTATDPALKYRRTRLKIGDEVIVIAGKEKGKRGQIMHVDKRRDRVVIQGVNRIKRFQRPTQENPQGGSIEIESPIHLSNVMFYDSKTKSGIRIGYRMGGPGEQKVRIGRKAGEEREIKEKAEK
ncbi:MAG: 50S ribosomal protein L24 [Spirochaetales bacterium]|nr:50S ribosomal protein L24 [Leptospiraceae bacterium]MCP5480115.1 50S ribosomal protein L24 [Spirochaetales bacterium]MCP5485545.1 50S ribosomal protein L24 [Spirochaetales bacterium]